MNIPNHLDFTYQNLTTLTSQKYAFYSYWTSDQRKIFKSHKQEGPLNITKNVKSSNRKDCLPPAIPCQDFILLPLLNSSMSLQSHVHTPPGPFTEVTPSHSAALIKCHFPREILIHPKVRWGSPFNLFWNSLFFSFAEIITFCT